MLVSDELDETRSALGPRRSNLPLRQPLTTGALVGLCHPRAADEEEFRALHRASEATLARWEPLPADGVHPTSEVGYARLLHAADTARHQKTLIYRLSDERIVGYVAINEIIGGPFLSGYLGYWIGDPYVRRGYGSEAVALCIDRAFTQLRLHRLEANIIPNNVASLGIARRCRLRKEGYSPRYLQIAGKYQDHERWAITSEEW